MYLLGKRHASVAGSIVENTQDVHRIDKFIGWARRQQTGPLLRPWNYRWKLFLISQTNDAAQDDIYSLASTSINLNTVYSPILLALRPLRALLLCRCSIQQNGVAVSGVTKDIISKYLHRNTRIRMYDRRLRLPKPQKYHEKIVSCCLRFGIAALLNSMLMRALVFGVHFTWIVLKMLHGLNVITYSNRMP